MNYNNEMKKIISNLDENNKLLLHSCCGPCSSSVIERLKNYFDITVLYYNPNIEPEEEFLKRKKEQIRLLDILNIPYLDIEYDNDNFTDNIKGYENDPENGRRCGFCYGLRLHKTARVAKENAFDFYATTLTVSPHKDSKLINDIGLNYAKRYNVNYLISDFKKENGYARSVELAKEFNLYRQNYCGCRYSKGGLDES